MFDLPKSTVVGRLIPKEKFYKKTAMNSKLRQLFTDEIDKIIWTHKISPDTLSVTKGEEPEELQFFEILLKGSDISKALLRHIDSSIPYPIIYTLKKPSSSSIKVITSMTSLKKELGMKAKNDDFVDTGWAHPSGPYVLYGNKVSHIYVGYLFQIAGIYTRPHSDPKTAIEEWERNMEKRKKVEALNKKIASEPSLAKRQDLARERHSLEQQHKGNGS